MNGFCHQVFWRKYNRWVIRIIWRVMTDTDFGVAIQRRANPRIGLQRTPAPAPKEHEPRPAKPGTRQRRTNARGRNHNKAKPLAQRIRACRMGTRRRDAAPPPAPHEAEDWR